MSKKIIFREVAYIFMLSLAFSTGYWFIFFGNDKVNPWFEKGLNYPVERQWYVSYLAKELKDVILMLLVVLLARNRKLTFVAAGTLLYYEAADFWLYLFNANRLYSYSSFFMSTMPVAAFAIYYSRKKIEEIKYREREDKNVWKRAKKEIEILGKPNQDNDRYDYMPFIETELYGQVL